MGTKFLSCFLQQTLAINTNIVFLCFDENVVEMRALYITHRRLKGDTQKWISHEI
jgi:hypothetical protein